MSVQRIFSLFICVIALLGIVGALGVPMFANGDIAGGFFPMIYSAALLCCGVAVFLSDKSKSNKEKFNVREWLLEGAHGKAFVFFLLNVLLLVALFIFGPLIAMFVFSILACFVLKRQTPRGMVLFSILYVILVYLVFVMILKMPFDRGIIFDMVRYL